MVVMVVMITIKMMTMTTMTVSVFSGTDEPGMCRTSNQASTCSDKRLLVNVISQRAILGFVCQL